MISCLVVSLLLSAAPITSATTHWFGLDIGVNTLVPSDKDFVREHEGSPALTAGASYSRFVMENLIMVASASSSSSFHLSQETPSAQNLSIGVGPGWANKDFSVALSIGLGVAALSTKPGCFPEAYSCDNVAASHAVPHAIAKEQALYFPLRRLGLDLAPVS